jgi:putative membrane protein (TIGR04086 family)
MPETKGSKGREGTASSALVSSICLGVAVACGVTAGGLALLALLVTRTGSEQAAGGLALLAVCLVSCLLGGLLAALRGKSRRLPVALAVALGWFVLWLAAGVVQYGSVSLMQGGVHLLAGLAGGGVAGLLAARK